MYLHIGSSRSIRINDIIGIFDMDTATVSPCTKEYLRKKEAEGKVKNAAPDIPKSFVVTKDGTVYISQMSSTTLKNR